MTFRDFLFMAGVAGALTGGFMLSAGAGVLTLGGLLVMVALAGER